MRFQICTKQSPPDSLVIEAAGEEQAKELAREDLRDWADQVELATDCEEDGTDGE